MTDQELEEYILVHDAATALCATEAPEEEHKIPAEYTEFKTCSRHQGIVSYQSIVRSTMIKIKDGEEPKFIPIYPLSQKESATLEEYIKDNLKKGNIQHSKSSAGYPILFVPKKGGELRMCVDYRQLNDITIKDRHPLPLINEIQDIIQGAKYFSKTKYGHYEYKVMPFGLTNAPASFQRFIFHILQGYLDKFVIAYLDDILVFSKTEEEHIEHNRKVLQRLREAEVTLKLKKCEFHIQQTISQDDTRGNNYDVHDKELLAIVSAFQTWRAYLEGAKHTAETLAQYDFKIVHYKGTENTVADALSRRPDYELGTKEAAPAILANDNEGNIVYNHQTLAATSEVQNDE
ncbi:hypothetical protein POX_g09114 [Penicillium oxalicum]|uniref:hypothetical protein n=1 Tax=Penicillium oxalicum TaxID=69781 RepID=UPI0020B6A0ED|nr:hypothetical protein POX_g09114 [Penicillium oxalicum]KAI2786722.1 hypothetical protein POX_g09114 [Penicillium oxalicum]